jgi:hypothetical protein
MKTGHIYNTEGWISHVSVMDSFTAFLASDNNPQGLPRATCRPDRQNVMLEYSLDGKVIGWVVSERADGKRNQPCISVWSLGRPANVHILCGDACVICIIEPLRPDCENLNKRLSVARCIDLGIAKKE